MGIVWEDKSHGCGAPPCQFASQGAGPSGLRSTCELTAVAAGKVVLIRPGATLYDEQNRVQGILDIPLSERGQDEATRLAESLAAAQEEHPLSALYCGPAENVVRTAEIVGKALGLKPRRIEELRNLDQGLWQGLQVEEIKRRNSKLFRQWIDDPQTICPPQGETVSSAFERVKAAFKPLLRRHQDGEAFGIVVCEPLARLISCYLKRAPRLQLDEHWPCCGFERIDIPQDLLANGFS